MEGPLSISKRVLAKAGIASDSNADWVDDKVTLAAEALGCLMEYHAWACKRDLLLIKIRAILSRHRLELGV